MNLNDYALLLFEAKKFLKSLPNKSKMLSTREKLLLRRLKEFLALVNEGDVNISQQKILPGSNQLEAYSIVQNALSENKDPSNHMLTPSDRVLIINTIKLLDDIDNGKIYDELINKHYKQAFFFFSSLARYSMAMIDIV
jgi:hypothetical protein